MKQSKLLRLVLSTVLVAPLLSVNVFADVAKDITGHWGESAITKWSEYGVVQGYPDGTFQPNQNITRGEFFQMINTIMDYQATASNTFTDLATSDGYADAVLKLVKAGVVTGADGKMNAQDNITREQAFAILARVFNVPTNTAVLGNYADGSKVASWAQGQVGGMIAAGYITGSGNTLRPSDSLTRAESVQVLDNMIKGYYHEAGTYEANVDGITIVNKSGVTLNKSQIQGDLYVTQGVKQGDFTLNESNVDTMYVQGGGTDSIHVDKSTVGQMSVQTSAATGAVRVDAGAGSVIDSLSLEAASQKLTLDGKGTLKDVTMQADTALVVNTATLEKLVVAGDNAKTTVNKGGYIKAADVKANNTAIDGTGKVGTVNVMSGSGNQVMVPGAQVSVSKDAGDVTTDQGTVKPGATSPAMPGYIGGGDGSDREPSVDADQQAAQAVIALIEQVESLNLDDNYHYSPAQVLAEGYQEAVSTASQAFDQLTSVQQDLIPAEVIKKLTDAKLAIRLVMEFGEENVAYSLQADGHHVVITGTYQMDQAEMTVPSGATLTVAENAIIKGEGTITVDNGATLVHSQDLYTSSVYNQGALKFVIDAGASVNMGGTQYVGEDGIFALDEGTVLTLGYDRDERYDSHYQIALRGTATLQQEMEESMPQLILYDDATLRVASGITFETENNWSRLKGHGQVLIASGATWINEVEEEVFDEEGGVSVVLYAGAAMNEVEDSTQQGFKWWIGDASDERNDFTLTAGTITFSGDNRIDSYVVAEVDGTLQVNPSIVDGFMQNSGTTADGAPYIPYSISFTSGSLLDMYAYGVTHQRLDNEAMTKPDPARYFEKGYRYERNARHDEGRNLVIQDLWNDLGLIPSYAD